MTDTATIIGWDIGGAHVKAALLRDGRLEAVRQWPCALWQGIHLLDGVLDDALAGWRLPRSGGAGGGSGSGGGGSSGGGGVGSGGRNDRAEPGAATHAVTMTGEMVDWFDNRRDGVERLARHLELRLGSGMRLFCDSGEWIAADEAGGRWRELASANWSATARLVASRLGGGNARAILVDIGSTTTDLIPLAADRVLAGGTTDAQRLHSGELLYHGAVRTPLCALVRRIDFRGAGYNVMNEWFATTADVYRLTGELDEAHDQHPTSDGGSKDLAGSCRRIARMIGHDAADAGVDEWIGFAKAWRLRQLELLAAELLRVESGVLESRGPSARLIGAGCGSFLVRALAQRLGREHVSFDDLVDAPATLRGWAGVCAPAVAVAMLRAQDIG